nr:6-bladed beta-propeller [Bacteroides fragilis]
MKNRIFYLFLIITLVLTACDQKLKNKSALISNIRVDFSEASFENFKRLNVVDTTLLIALAEDVENDLVLGQLDKIIILNDTIYIADTYLKRLLMYDMQGNILGKIGNLGGGPGEFASLSDFCVKKMGAFTFMIVRVTKYLYMVKNQIFERLSVII